MTSPAKRVFEWFWRGAALARARQLFPAPGDREVALTQRARNSAESARNLLTPADVPEDSLRADACESYRQAAYWALSALAARTTAAVDLAYTDSTWDGLDEQLLARATEGPGRADALRSALRGGSFVFFAELRREEQVALCIELQSLVELLFERLNERSRALLALYFQSCSRICMLVLLVLGGLVVAFLIHRSRDLAHGRPWRASSAYSNVGCQSPSQECAEGPGFFFHTNEEQDPWVVFDLGAAKRISMIEIDNREDCCTERAFPLTVEVSTDNKSWKLVARKDDEFKTWRTSFDAVSARWVRLRILKRTNLHLAAVRIFP